MRGWKVFPAAAAAGALLVGAVGLAAAQAEETTEVTVPPPPASAEAIAAGLELGGNEVLGISHTKAEAGGSASDSSAEANVLELGGAVPSEQFGGKQSGKGSSSGALIDTAGTGLDQLGRLAVAPWNASVDDADNTRRSESHASVVEVTLAPGGTKIVDLKVLTSDSLATHTSEKSVGTGSSDGVVLVLGDPEGGQGLEIVVLHSEASSEAGAKSYLVRIGDTEIGSNEDELGQGIADICSSIEIPDLLKLTCVQAAGGLAQVAKVVGGDGGANGGVIDLIAATGGGGAAGLVPEVKPPAPPELPRGPEAKKAAERGRLAVTGSNLVWWLQVGIALTGAGVLAEVLRRRMETVPV